MAGSRILVAVSTPWASDKLCATIEDLADRLEASVIVAHVARPTEEDDSAEETRQRGERTLQSLTDRLDNANLPSEKLLLYGDDVGRAILNASDEQQATLIVLGLSGKGRMARLLAGDIPQQIIRQSRVPVLCYPPDWSGTI
ncbi:MAG: universal stress protein [Phycisphaeraceae bacterium]